MIWIKASDLLPIIDRDNPQHYLFINDVTHNAVNICSFERLEMAR